VRGQVGLTHFDSVHLIYLVATGHH
jgi:hypothetical protein